MKHHGLYQSAHAAREPSKPARASKEPKHTPYPSSPSSPPVTKRAPKSSYRKGCSGSEMHEENYIAGDDDEGTYLGGSGQVEESGGRGEVVGEEVKMEDGMMGMMMVKSEPLAHGVQQGVPEFHDMGGYHPEAGYQLAHGAGAGGFQEVGDGAADGGLVFSEFLQPGAFEEVQQGEDVYGMVGQGWRGEEVGRGRENVFVVD